MNRLSEAQKLYNEGKLKEAEALYRNISQYGTDEEKGLASSILFHMYHEGLFGEVKDMDSFLHKGLELGSPLAFFYFYIFEDNISPKDFKYFVKDLKKLADDGCTAAMIEIAMIYEYGINRKKDDHKALQWYEKAARMGDVIAFLHAGLILMMNPSIEEDARKGYLYFLKAASFGYSPAEYLLGVCFLKGHGVEPDMDRAIAAFQKAAEHGNVDGAMKLWELYRKGIPDENGHLKADPEKAFYYLQMAADRENKDAIMNMGMCFLNGYGTEMDAEKALYWYQKAWDQGNTMAGSIIGTMYVKGLLGEGKEGEGFSMLKQAAQEGSIDALREMGYFYLEGMGVPKDEEEGLRMLHEAAEEGDGESFSRIGIYYLKKDEKEKAFDYFSKAAVRGDASGEYHLAHFYLQGIFVPKNIRKAASLLQQAKEKGFYEAEKELAQITEA